MRKLWQTRKVKMGEKSIKSMKSRTQKGGYSKCVHMRTRGRWLKNRSKDTYVLNGWPQTYVVEYFLRISPAEYTRASPPARKCRCFLPSRIYTILHIYLQVSKTEGLVELHCVIRLNVLEKINSIYFQGISLVLSRIRCPS